ALNPALVSATGATSFADVRADAETWGRLAETACGAHLVNSGGPGCEVFYWRERNREVDFVVRRGKRVTAIEVTTGRTKSLSGLETFGERFGARRKLLVGGPGLPIEEFLTRSADVWTR